MPSKRYNSKRSFGTRFNDIKETFEVLNKETAPDKIINEGVDYAQLEVNSIDTTTINYGGISASNFSEGAKIASGESNQRVPSELTDVEYWQQVTAGLLELHKQGFHNDEDIQNVEATSNGILFTPTADAVARIYLTSRIPVPKSRKIYSIFEADRACTLRLIWWRNSQSIEVTKTSTTAGVATITTATEHGLIVGKEIRVTGLDVDYNGYHTITAVDTYSISYTSPTQTATDDLIEEQWETRGSVNLEDYVYEELTNKEMWNANYRVANVSNKVLTNNLATLTTNATHSFVVGDIARISGIDAAGTDPSVFDGAYKVYSVTDTTLSYQKVNANVASAAVSPAVSIFTSDSTSATEYAVYLEVPANDPTLLLKSAKVFEVIGYGSKEPLYANVNTSVLTNNVATLTTSLSHGFSIESTVVVSNVGSPYDGTHVISGTPTTNTFTYTVVSANVASNSSVVGKAVAYDGKQHSELTPDGLRLYQPDGTLAVDLTTSGNSVFNIYNGSNVVTSIDTEGNGTFASLDSDQFVLNGIDIVGNFANAEFNGYAYNKFNTAATGEIEVENSYLNWLARGVVYEGFSTANGNFTLDTGNTYYTLASGYFSVEANRSYSLQLDFGSMYVNNPSNVAAYFVLKMGTGPLIMGGVETYYIRSLVGPTTQMTIGTKASQFDAINQSTSLRVIGTRVQSNVVTLLLESDPSAASVVSSAGNFVGVTGVGYPYDGYYSVSALDTYTVNTISYSLIGTRMGANSATTSRTVTTNLVSGTKNVLVANTAGLYPGFPLTKTAGTGVFGTGAVVNVVTNATHFTTNVNHTTSGTMTFSTIQFVDTSSSITAKVTNELDISAGTLPYNTPIYYTLEAAATSPNVNISVSYSSYPLNTSTTMFSVIDIGQAKGDSWVDMSDYGRRSVGSTATEFASGGVGTTTTATITVNADQSAYYDGYGRGTGTSDPYAYRYSLYQGNPGTSSGTKKSAIRFPALGLPAGSTVTKAELYLRNRHSYSASGLTCYIGAHIDTNLEDQTTAPTQSATIGTSTIDTHFDKGQGKWVDVTTWASYIASGTLRGFLIGLSSAPSTWYSSIANYGYFDGNTMSDEPKLKITYEYTA